MDKPDRPWREVLLQDWHRYSPGAPRWKTVVAAIVYNAGFSTCFLFRLAQELRRRGHRRSARLAHRLNMVLGGCELSPEARVDPGLHLPHPFGVTIGTGCRVGSGATLYQGVVLGARESRGPDGATLREYPTLEDGITLYPHVLVYGPVRIGSGAVVLGNSVVSKDVPPGATHGGVPAVEIAGRKSRSERRARAEESPIDLEVED